MFAALYQDVRFALRLFRKSPVFTATAVTVLALGLGANIAVFTLISGILLRPLPYVRADRIVEIDGPSNNGFFDSLNYADLRQLTDALGSSVKTGMILDRSNASVAGPGGRLQIQKVEITAGLMDTLGQQPMLGRNFRSDENNPGRGSVVLLSESVWRRLYASDPDIIGKSLIIRSKPFTIVGVMPKGFLFPMYDETEVWVPAPIDAAMRAAVSGENQLQAELYARLPDGMTAQQLNANLDRVQAVIAREVSTDPPPSTVSVIGYQAALNQEARKPLGLLYVVVLGIWVLACMNVTSLMMARAVVRSREQAVRSALGASRLRLLQQSIVESLLLSGAGALAGLLAGEAAIKILWRQITRNLPLTNEVHVDWRIVAALSVLTLLTALAVGLAPALRASRSNVQRNLHGVNSTASGSQHRTREILVVAQLALTLVFLVGAGLFLRTIHALRQVPLGFTQQNVLTGGIVLHQGSGSEDSSESAAPGTAVPSTTVPSNVVQSYYLPLLARLEAIPGVKTVALSSVLPMRSEFAVGLAVTLDHHKVSQAQSPQADGRLASAGLVEAMGIPMVQGRFFTEADSAAAPVVVVANEAFVKRYLGGGNALGHTISMGDKGPLANARIVGVVGDVKQTNVTKATKPELYFCLAQTAPSSPLYGIAAAFMQVAIRGRVPADALRAQFDKALHEVAPDATTTGVKTIHEAVEDSFGSQTITSYLLEGFAGLALLIACVGLYGLLSFLVAQRTREIGLRLALGAQRSNILRLVLSRALVLVLAGLVSGMAMAWFAVSLARTYIFGVEAHDALTFVAVALVLAATSFLAALMPARLAASIEPMIALRSE